MVMGGVTPLAAARGFREKFLTLVELPPIPAFSIPGLVGFRAS
jgi:hypothetical protein